MRIRGLNTRSPFGFTLPTLLSFSFSRHGIHTMRVFGFCLQRLHAAVYSGVSYNPHYDARDGSRDCARCRVCRRRMILSCTVTCTARS